MVQQIGAATPLANAESPWVAAMIRYVVRCGSARVGAQAQRIIDLTRRIECATDESDRVACRLRRAECWAALAAASDQTDPDGVLCALACHCAAVLDGGAAVH
jgi:hypothetical protein